jgi:hypothetical protein
VCGYEYSLYFWMINIIVALFTILHCTTWRLAMLSVYLGFMVKVKVKVKIKVFLCIIMQHLMKAYVE